MNERRDSICSLVQGIREPLPYFFPPLTTALELPLRPPATFLAAPAAARAAKAAFVELLGSAPAAWPMRAAASGVMGTPPVAADMFDVAEAPDCGWVGPDLPCPPAGVAEGAILDGRERMERVGEMFVSGSAASGSGSSSRAALTSRGERGGEGEGRAASRSELWEASWVLGGWVDLVDGWVG